MDVIDAKIAALTAGLPVGDVTELRRTARDLMLYADECALILKATHPAKAQSLEARNEAVRAALVGSQAALPTEEKK